MCAKLLQSRLTLCDTMDCSPPSSSVHRILQARILEWDAVPKEIQVIVIFTYLKPCGKRL